MHMYHERQQKRERKKKNQLQPRTQSELLKIDCNNLWTDKDLQGDADPPSTGVSSGHTQLFLWGYVAGPGHTQDHSRAEQTLSVPSAPLCSLIMNFSAKAAQHCKHSLSRTEVQQTTTCMFDA